MTKRRRTLLSLAAALVLMAGTATLANAATITIINMDGSGEGFNDVSEPLPVGGNDEPTLGGQRLAAAQFAADIWGSMLDSDVEIEVAAFFDELFCNRDGAVLATAGPNCLHKNFAGAPDADIIYPAALANKLADTDLCPPASGCNCEPEDITAIFNSGMDGGCTFGETFYYGFDAAAGSDEIDFVSVVLHELAHGLGFLTFVDGENGRKFQKSDDHFMRFLEDHSLGMTWDEMSYNSQRAASALDNFDLHWVGQSTVDSSAVLDDGLDEATGHVYMYAPETFFPGSSVSHFDISMWPNQLLEPFYTAANHNVSLAADVMVDIGWGELLPSCGDGRYQPAAGEQCDTGGETADCDADCTIPECGDDIVNAAAGEDCETDGETALCDDDCTDVECGDGNINESAGEECDDGEETATCDADCTTAECGDGDLNRKAGEECDDGNGVDADGCDSNCTPTACGNGVVAGNEVCDDGDTVDGNGCDSDCTTTSCGNGIVTGDEECDEGGETATCDSDCTGVECGDGTPNGTAGEDCDDDGESAGCDADCSVAQCGDGTVNTTAGETCDDSGESAGCDVDCTAVACGDGTRNATVGEDCDDGGESASCDADCSDALCGDGTLNTTAAEICDDGNTISADGCDVNCTPTGCGNGVITGEENCDDGNSVDGDGCDSGCEPEEGWNCGGVPTVCSEICGDLMIVGDEDCEDGNSVDGDDCDSNCLFTRCGNGIVTEGEECDGGGETVLCDVDCTAVTCGDGVTNAAVGEECDDGLNTATCDADCTLAVCGDETVNEAAGETCDEGAETADCDSDCTESECGDGVLNVAAGEGCDDGNNEPGDGCAPACYLRLMICGDANYTITVTASDALLVVRRSVGQDVLCADWTCDVNNDNSITVTDALLVLQTSVGIDVELDCGGGAVGGGSTQVVLYLYGPVVSVGSLQVDIDYNGVNGEILGDGKAVQCTNLVENAEAAFNKLPGRHLAMSFASPGGFIGGRRLATCTFVPSGLVHPLDFSYEIIEATEPNNDPLVPDDVPLEVVPY